MTSQKIVDASPIGEVLQRRDVAPAAGQGAQTSGQDAATAFDAIPNGPAAAAILTVGIGCFAVGLFATLGDAFLAVARFFNFYNPTGRCKGSRRPRSWSGS